MSGIGTSRPFARCTDPAAFEDEADSQHQSRHRRHSHPRRFVETSRLCRDQHIVNLIEDSPEFLIRKATHGSIRVQEGQPVYLRVSGDLAESGQRGR
jgi:hypothetical protein